MPRDYPRTRRIAEQIQRELAEVIRLELKDPRVASLVTITDVEVSPDQSHAKVFFTLLGDSSKIAETTEGLKRAAGFLRTQLAHRVKLRTVPQLEFRYDASVERGVKLSRLIDEAVASPGKDSSDK
jgi:ribosome-binding factor A